MTTAELLSPLTGCVIPTGVIIDYDNRSKDDFNENITDEKDSEENISSRNSRIVETYEKLGKKKQTIAFCASVNQAIKLAEAFKAKGIKAEAIHSKLKNSEIASFIEDFRNGKLRVLTNVSKLSEGFESRAKCVILARPFLNPRSFRVILPLLISRVLTAPGISLALQFVDEKKSKKTEEEGKSKKTEEKEEEANYWDLDVISGFGHEQKSKIEEDKKTGDDELLLKLKEEKFQHQTENFLQNSSPRQKTGVKIPKYMLIEIEKVNFLEILDDLFDTIDPESPPFVFSIPLLNNEDLLLLEVEKVDAGFTARQPGNETMVFASASNKKDLLKAVRCQAQLELAKPTTATPVLLSPTKLIKFFISRNGGEENSTEFDENKIKLLLLLELTKAVV